MSSLTASSSLADLAKSVVDTEWMKSSEDILLGESTLAKLNVSREDGG